MLESIAKQVIRETAGHVRPSRALITQAELAAKKAARGAEKTAERTVMQADRSLVKTAAGRAEAAVLKNPTVRNAVTFHVDPAASHAAMIDSIKNAKDSFYIETFIWHNDAAGNEVIAAMAERIKRAKAEGKPFDAKVLIDWFGLRQGTGGATDTQIVDKLRTAGVDVLEFARGWVDDGKWIPITHRKLYVQDGTQFMTGGRNIGDEYGKAAFTNPKGKVEPGWHDLLYTVQGEETGRIITEFYRNWERAGGKRPLVRPTIVPHPTGRTKIESFITDPHVKIHSLAKAHVDLILNAEKSITVMYPYLSDDKLVKALITAKKKNPKLEIRIILPASKEASAEGGIYSLLNKETARQLMKHGIEVRMYAGPVKNGEAEFLFSHFKGMVIDREIVSVGSANGDARTFLRNHELNTVIADKRTAEDFLKQVADKDWADAAPLTKADLAADTFWTRVKQTALELLDFLL